LWRLSIKKHKKTMGRLGKVMQYDFVGADFFMGGFQQNVGYLKINSGYLRKDAGYLGTNAGYARTKIIINSDAYHVSSKQKQPRISQWTCRAVFIYLCIPSEGIEPPFQEPESCV